MWKCPICKREFKNTNQHHFCKKAENIDAYIAMQATDVQPILQKVCTIIREIAPKCTEKMSHHMPTFWQGKILIQLAAHKNHLGFYPGADTVEMFAKQLSQEGFHFNKGSIQFPWDKPIPYELIADIAKYRIGK